jgi:AcrR family transcriptional regulator
MYGIAMDRRVRKTREALYAAFVSLIVERGYDATTVQEILDEADVGRSTFYTHFTGKEELLRHGFVRLREQLHAAGAGDDGGPFGFLEPLLAHAKTHAGLYAALLRVGAGGLAEVEFRKLVAERLSAAMAGSSPLAVAATTGALIGGLQHWLDTGARGSGADVAETVRRIAAV